jgi:hypothetical protein
MPGGGGGCLEDALIFGGLLLVQCIVAGYVVFVGHLLALGAHPLAVIIIAGAASSSFFLPFAVALERYLLDLTAIIILPMFALLSPVILRMFRQLILMYFLLLLA